MAFKNITTLFLTTLFLIPCPQATATVVKSNATSRQVLKATGRLHVPFVENRGQADDPAVAYVADILACRVAVTRKGEIIYSQPSQKKGDTAVLEIKERLVGPHVKIDVTGRQRQAAKVSYYQGRDPGKWYANLPTYARIGLGRTAPGIRAELRAHGRNVEKLFYLAPGADPSHIRLAVEGAQNLSVGADGALELSAPSGKSMRFTKPVAYQQINGRRNVVPVRYRVCQNSYGFEVGHYDRSRELVIDPLVKVFSVKTEWKDAAIIDAVADAQGNVYAAGYFNYRLAIWKLDSRLENLLASVYFSSDGRFVSDAIRSIALDSQGNVFVAGYVGTHDFPVTPGCHDAKGDPVTAITEGFVTKFSSDLGTMMASTFIGGDGRDRLFAMVINGDQIYVAGFSEHMVSGAQPFPVTAGAFDTVPGSDYQEKAVVARLDNDLSTVEAATFLGGVANSGLEHENEAYCLAIDVRGDVWVAGHTLQPDFPVTDGCGDVTYNGDGDVFLSKFDAELKHLLLSTYVGANQDEAPTDMLLDGQGNVYLSGYTFSGNFPIPDSGYDTDHSLVEEDGFIVKISPGADKILGGTFLGGTDSVLNEDGDDVPGAMALTADGKELVVVGRTESQSFPTTPGCIDDVLVFSYLARPNRDITADSDQGDGFVTTLSGDLTRLINSTLIGGDRVEYLDAVLINGDDIIVGGETQTAPSGGGFPFPLGDDENAGSMAILMRFTIGETPGDPGGVTTGSGGGGGGGCLIGSIIY